LERGHHSSQHGSEHSVVATRWLASKSHLANGGV
jgi:hypothetical protein